MVTIDYRDLLNRLEHTTAQGPRYRHHTPGTATDPGSRTDHQAHAAARPGPGSGNTRQPASDSDPAAGLGLPVWTRLGPWLGLRLRQDPGHRVVRVHRPRHPLHRPQNRLRRRHHPRPARQRRTHPGHRPHHPDLPAPHPQSHHRPRPRLRLPQLHHPRTLVRSPPHHLLVTRRTHQHRQRHPPLHPSPPPHPQRTMANPRQKRHPLVHPATPHRPPPKTPTKPPSNVSRTGNQAILDR